MLKKALFGLWLFFFFVGIADAQGVLHYGAHFPKASFVNIENNQKRILPSKGKPALFFFSYAPALNNKEVPFLETLQKGYGKYLSVYHVIDSKNEAYEGDALTTVKSLRKDTFNFDFYTRKNFLLVNKKGVVRFTGPVHALSNFSRILEQQGIPLKKPDTKTLNDFLKHTLSIKNIPAFDTQKKKLVILLRSVCQSCGIQRAFNDILGSIRHAKLNTRIMLVFRNKRVKQQFTMLDIDSASLKKIDQVYISNPTKQAAQYFIKGNPLLLCFDNSNVFINYRIADDFTGLALYSYLIRTLHN